MPQKTGSVISDLLGARAPSLAARNRFPVLLPGDILLYGGNNLLQLLIQLRTWSDVAHVEIYAGDGRVLASRADGPREYPLGIIGLRYVIRPVAPFDWYLGRRWFDDYASKLPYGYFDLGQFYSINIATRGLICSEFADLFFQKCGLLLFNPDYFAGAVCPRDFKTLSPLLAKQIWYWKNS